MRLNTFLKTISLSLALLSPTFAGITVGELTLNNYWVRPGTISKNTAAYVSIHNPSLLKDKLLNVSCEACLATELHNHLNENGIMKMRPVKTIEIEGPQVDLKPGSLHIMLMGLKKDLQKGEIIKIQLHFEKAGAVEVDFTVGSPGEETA